MEDSIKHFELLCLSYEGLLKKEQFALKEKNMSYLERIARKKSGILDAIEAIKGTVDFSRERIESIREQFYRLKLLQDENDRILEEAMSKIEKELVQSSAERNQFLNIKNSYMETARPIERNQFEA